MWTWKLYRYGNRWYSIVESWCCPCYIGNINCERWYGIIWHSYSLCCKCKSWWIRWNCWSWSVKCWEIILHCRYSYVRYCYCRRCHCKIYINCCWHSKVQSRSKCVDRWSSSLNGWRSVIERWHCHLKETSIFATDNSSI